jgi:hypothetical protein
MSKNQMMRQAWRIFCILVLSAIFASHESEAFFKKWQKTQEYAQVMSAYERMCQYDGWSRVHTRDCKYLGAELRSLGSSRYKKADDGKALRLLSFTESPDGLWLNINGAESWRPAPPTKPEEPRYWALPQMVMGSSRPSIQLNHSQIRERKAKNARMEKAYKEEMVEYHRLKKAPPPPHWSIKPKECTRPKLPRPNQRGYQRAAEGALEKVTKAEKELVGQSKQAVRHTEAIEALLKQLNQDTTSVAGSKQTIVANWQSLVDSCAETVGRMRGQLAEKAQADLEKAKAMYFAKHFARVLKGCSFDIYLEDQPRRDVSMYIRECEKLPSLVYSNDRVNPQDAIKIEEALSQWEGNMKRLQKLESTRQKILSRCETLANAAINRTMAMKWKKCMSKADLSSTARRYNVTDDDLYRDYMTKKASSCSGAIGLSSKFKSFYKVEACLSVDIAQWSSNEDVPELCYEASGSYDICIDEILESRYRAESD